MVTAGTVAQQKPWYCYVADSQGAELLSCLQELSRLQEIDQPAFLVIGGTALLLQGVAQSLQGWDIDLIFRDKLALFDFLRAEKHPQLRVEFLGEGTSQRTGLEFVHTLWCFHHRWINVDHIIREGYFDFYLATAQATGPFSQRIDADNQTYCLPRLLAHPWDVIIDKLTLGRFEVSLEMLSWLDKDLPHIWDVLKLSGNDPAFYAHLTKQAEKLGKSQFLRENLYDRQPFSQTVQADAREYYISLLLGDPWDIFVDKLTLSRVVEQLENEDFFSKDVRHLVITLQRDGSNHEFCRHIVARSDAIRRREGLRVGLIKLIQILSGLGHPDVCNQETVVKYFGKLE